MTVPQRAAPLGRAGVAGAIIAGLVIAPGPSQISELTVFRSGASDGFAPARIEALTRSSLSDEDLQPTLVTAAISPANKPAPLPPVTWHRSN